MLIWFMKKIMIQNLILNSPINMYVDGDWIKAQGTTLGADNGLGVATIMALLESKNISRQNRSSFLLLMRKQE